MLCTDSSVEAVHHVVNPIHRIPAQNIYVVLVDELVPESLHLNRSYPELGSRVMLTNFVSAPTTGRVWS